jgi:hypothetical protein
LDLKKAQATKAGLYPTKKRLHGDRKETINRVKTQSRWQGKTFAHNLSDKDKNLIFNSKFNHTSKQ